MSSLSLYQLCYKGDSDAVHTRISNDEITSNNVDNGLYGACIGGHLELANLMIENGATDFDIGLECACQGGHLDLANLLIAKGATDFDNGLACACKGGKVTLMTLMVEKGATNFVGAVASARWHLPGIQCVILLDALARLIIGKLEKLPITVFVSFSSFYL